LCASLLTARAREEARVPQLNPQGAGASSENSCSRSGGRYRAQREGEQLTCTLKQSCNQWLPSSDANSRPLAIRLLA